MDVVTRLTVFTTFWDVSLSYFKWTYCIILKMQQSSVFFNNWHVFALLLSVTNKYDFALWSANHSVQFLFTSKEFSGIGVITAPHHVTLLQFWKLDSTVIYHWGPFHPPTLSLRGEGWAGEISSGQWSGALSLSSLPPHFLKNTSPIIWSSNTHILKRYPL